MAFDLAGLTVGSVIVLLPIGMIVTNRKAMLTPEINAAIVAAARGYCATRSLPAATVRRLAVSVKALTMRVFDVNHCFTLCSFNKD